MCSRGRTNISADHQSELRYAAVARCAAAVPWGCACAWAGRRGELGARTAFSPSRAFGLPSSRALPLDRSARVNPTFASFHRVLLGYCDGGSFLGDSAAPLATAGGGSVYMRGRRVLQAQLM